MNERKVEKERVALDYDGKRNRLVAGNGLRVCKE